MTASEIRWGTDYENALAFDPFPTDGSAPTLLDNVRTWRRPVPGSRRARNDAGVTDAWIAARDYMVAGRARYFGQAWGANGLQAFLDWAGEGNTFRLIPDRRYPSFYVADCYLDEPFDNPEPQLEDTDGTQSIDLVIRQQTTDFSRALRGVMWEYLPGMDITAMGGTFARTTPAYQTDRNGVLRQVASGKLRDSHFVGGVRHVFLEPARTNICRRSQEFDHATWAKAAATVSANADVAPDGTATADRFIEDNTTNSHALTETITITADASVAMSVYAKAGPRSFVRLKIADSTSTHFVNRWFDLSTGAVGTTSSGGTGGHVRSYVEALGNGWYRCVLVATVGSAVTAALGQAFLATADGVGSYAGDGASYVSLWGAQVEDSAVFATSYIPTTDVSATRNGDDLDFALPAGMATPLAFTAYAKFLETGAALVSLIGGANPRVFQISNTGGNTNSVRVVNASLTNNYGAVTNNGGTEANANMTGGVSLGDVVELRGVFPDAATDTLLGRSVNGAAEALATSATDAAVPAAWQAGATINIAKSTGSAGSQGCMALRSIRFMVGTRTLSEVRAA